MLLVVIRLNTRAASFKNFKTIASFYYSVVFLYFIADDNYRKFSRRIKSVSNSPLSLGSIFLFVHLNIQRGCEAIPEKRQNSTKLLRIQVYFYCNVDKKYSPAPQRLNNKKG